MEVVTKVISVVWVAGIAASLGLALFHGARVAYFRIQIDRSRDPNDDWWDRHYAPFRPNSLSERGKVFWAEFWRSVLLFVVVVLGGFLWTVLCALAAAAFGADILAGAD